MEEADEILVFGVNYIRLEATNTCWKGQRKTGSLSGILRIDRLKEYWFIAASQVRYNQGRTQGGDQVY